VCQETHRLTKSHKGFDTERTHIFEDRVKPLLDGLFPGEIVLANNREPSAITKPDFILANRAFTIDHQNSYGYGDWMDFRADIVSCGWPENPNELGRWSTRRELMRSLVDNLESYEPSVGVTRYVEECGLRISTMGKLYGAGKKRVDSLIVMYFAEKQCSLDAKSAMPQRIQFVGNAHALRHWIDDHFPELVSNGQVKFNDKRGKAIGGSDPYWSAFVVLDCDWLVAEGFAKDIPVKKLADSDRKRRWALEVEARPQRLRVVKAEPAELVTLLCPDGSELLQAA
jgi:hypothetical protein